MRPVQDLNDNRLLDAPRARVLGQVIAALNRADGNSRRFYSTSEDAYWEAVRSAIPLPAAPRPTTAAPHPGDRGHEDTVIPFPRTATG